MTKAKDTTEFYVSVPLGWEQDLEDEIREFWPYLLEKNGRPHHFPFEVKDKEKGGLSFVAPEILGYQVNFFSKISHRVLERVASFSVRDFAKLQQRLKKIDWRPWFGDENFLLEIAASRSRLLNEKSIMQVARASWKKAVENECKFRVFLRMHEDLCTVSVDTTGEHLHFRGYKSLVGEAPLRETLAAWMLRQLTHDKSAAELQNIRLVDPMAGSGTLLVEACELFRPNFHRTYSCLRFFKTPKILKSTAVAANYPTFPTLFGEFLACDHDAKMAQVMKENLKAWPIEVRQEDLLQGSFQRDSKPCWLITNPPYGERLPLAFRWQELREAIVKKYEPERWGILLPQSALSEWPEKFLNYQRHSVGKTKNGGLPVVFLLYQNAN